jgi:tetratricopeptide (TPR) repeat protein
MVAPVTIRNWRVSGEPVVVACNGPINFYIGNNPDADGYSFTQASLREVTGLPTWGWFSYDRVVRGLEQRTGKAMSYGDASRYFNGLARDYIKANPGRFIELCIKRAILFWGPVEVPNNKVERLERAHSPLLRLLPNYSLMLALTLAGLTVLLLPRRHGDRVDQDAEPRPARQRECLTLVGVFVLVYFVSFVPFLAATRFRAPLLPIVFVFAAFALERLWLSMRARRWSAAAMLAGVVAALTLAFMWIASAVDVDLRDVPRWHTDRGAAFANAQRHQDAVREYQQAIDFNDKYVAAYTAWFESALALGEIDQCIAVAERLRAARPDRTDAMNQMAGQLAERGQQALRERRAADAVSWLGASVSLNASQPVALCDLATALSQTNQMEQAVQRYHEALAIKPDFAEAWFNLGVAQHRVNKLTEAADAYRKAIEFRPRYIEALINLGQIDAMQGRFDEAQRRLEAALAIDPANAAARQSLEQLNQMRRGAATP